MSHTTPPAAPDTSADRRPYVRSAAKAIILENDALLCVRFLDERGTTYGLPGGGQDPHEDLRQTAARECREEIDCEVEVHELLFVREFIGPRHAAIEAHKLSHQIDHYFRCRLIPGSCPANGPGADTIQQGVEWVPLERLAEVGFHPRALIPWLTRLAEPGRPVYLE